jgi:succinate dehydrogenase/fumarate reductase flavoprotein subunit
MLHTLYQQVVKRGVEVYDEWYVTRLAVTDHDDPDERACHGFVAIDVRSGDLAGFQARQGVILATGGAGQVYEHTTNAIANTGDGHAKGTEAAAATAVVVTESAPPEWGEIRFDRPFLFCIRDRPTNAVLFLGRIVDAGAAQG